MRNRPLRVVGPSLVLALAVVGAALLTTAAPEPSARAGGRAHAAIDPAAGLTNLEHVVFVVQENRSFDHYFGTFPGADGIPRTPSGRFDVCVPDPEAHVRCRRPYHDTNGFDAGGPHNVKASRISVDHGRMDGFIRAIADIGVGCRGNPDRYNCRQATPGPNGTPDALGFHTAKEIPNYWAYARHFTLQDRMFAPTDSWTLPSHLYLVSGWSARCSDPKNGRSCRSNLRKPTAWWTLPKTAPPPYAWADITWLLWRAGVSWRYYVGPDSCLTWPCTPKATPTQTIPLQNPLPGFADVHASGQTGNVAAQADYFTAAAAGSLPSVSWVMPTFGRSEHPPQYIPNGQAWVTRVVNAVMQGPPDQWAHTAIFIVWDDWGGFYDHVRPIRVDPNGYGIRVPGIMISPYAKGGVDHQVLSLDAYLKLIEDRWLGGQRLDGSKKYGWPDSRPTTRESAARLGDLAKEFDWSRAPIPPLVLDPTP